MDRAALRFLSAEEYERSLSRARRSVEERAELFREYLPPGDLSGLRTMVVDDGLATGYTMLAAVKTVRELGVREVVVAVPTASYDSIELLLERVDTLAVLNLRTGLPYAVADAYKRWRDLTEAEVLELLRRFEVLD